jgi:transposase-like protein
LCGAGRYERSEARRHRRAGSQGRALQTKAGEVKLKIPKLRRRSFVTAIIEPCRRRESAVGEAPIGMDLAGVSVRRVEDIAGALRGDRVSPSMGSDLDRKICARIDSWRNRQIKGGIPTCSSTASP